MFILKFASQVADNIFEKKLEWGDALTADHLRYTYFFHYWICQRLKCRKWGLYLLQVLTFLLCNDSYLAEEIYNKPVIIYNYPKEVKPFYARLNDDRKTVAAFDMVVPKVSPEWVFLCVYEIMNDLSLRFPHLNKIQVFI